MSDAGFQWDETKAAANLAKHGLRFAVAVAIFSDPWSVDYDVSRAEDQESRRKIVGVIDRVLCSVVYTFRDEKIRIISARRANKTERKIYGYRRVRT